MLDRVTIGWVWLERTLNRIIDALNQQKPLPSSSIAVEESPTGTLLKVVAIQASPDQGTGKASGGGGGTGGGGGAPPAQYPPAPPTGYAGWHEIAIYDVDAVSVMYIWYWGTGPTFTA